MQQEGEANQECPSTATASASAGDQPSDTGTPSSTLLEGQSSMVTGIYPTLTTAPATHATSRPRHVDDLRPTGMINPTQVSDGELREKGIPGEDMQLDHDQTATCMPKEVVERLERMEEASTAQHIEQKQMLKDVKSEMEKLASRATSQPKEKSLQEQIQNVVGEILAQGIADVHATVKKHGDQILSIQKQQAKEDIERQRLGEAVCSSSSPGGGDDYTASDAQIAPIVRGGSPTTSPHLKPKASSPPKSPKIGRSSEERASSRSHPYNTPSKTTASSSDTKTGKSSTWDQKAASCEGLQMSPRSGKYKCRDENKGLLQTKDAANVRRIKVHATLD